MPLTLVTGRTNSGKTGRAYACVMAAAQEGRDAVLALPTHPDVQRAEREMAQRVAVGVRAVTLDGWMSELWQLLGDGRRIVSDAARSMLCSRAASETECAVIAEESRGPGLARLIAELVRRHGTSASVGSGVEGDVAAIVSVYADILRSRGLVEIRDAVDGLLTRLDGISAAVAVHRFTDLSPAQERFVHALSETTDVVVTLSWESGRPATQALDPLVDRLAKTAAEHVVLPSVAGNAELDAVGLGLYVPREVTLEPSGAVSVSLATGLDGEAAMAAREAARLKSAGFAADRIAVAFRDAERRLPALRAAFTAEGVDADFDVAVRFSATPLGRAMTALLGACGDIGSPGERIMAFLGSPYSGVETRRLAEADARWRTDRLSGPALLAEVAKLGEAARRAVECASALVTSPGGETAVREWENLAGHLLRQGLMTKGRESHAIEMDAAAHRSALRVAADLSVGGAEGITASELVAAAKDAVVTTGRTETPGRVQVTEAHRLRSRRFDAVVIGGLTAGEFSAEQTESLADEMAVALGFREGPDRRLSERLLFYLVVSAARERLVLLRQVGDSSGRAIRPSAFWEEVLDLYERPEVDETAIPAGMEVRRLRLTDIAGYAPAFLPGRARLREEPDMTASARVRASGVLADADVLALLARPREYSVTELEVYSQCPYRWFVEHAVRTRELDRELDARERGSRAHRMIATFYERWRSDLGFRRVTEERVDDALSLLDEVAREVERTSHVQAKGLAEELEVARSHRWARRIIAEDAVFLPQFEPVAHEFAFGEDHEKPVDLGGVRLKGRVDRVDVSDGTLLVVTDYKAAAVHGHASFETHGLLQIPVYAEVVRQCLGVRIGGGLYRSLRGLSARGFWDRESVSPCAGLSDVDAVTEGELDALIAGAVDKLRAAAAGIQQGRIAPERSTRDACTYCAVTKSCEASR